VTHEERLKLLTEWRDASLALDEAAENFTSLLGIEDLERCPILLAAWRLHEAYTTSLSARVGDKYDWLNWWWYDAKRGKGTCEVTLSAWDKPKPIRTVEDLCEVIEADLQ